jgi:hypothetical protein
MTHKHWLEAQIAVTRDMLDNCVTPSGLLVRKDKIKFTSECHGRSYLIAEYYDGELTLKCPTCLRKVLIIKVARA